MVSLPTIPPLQKCKHRDMEFLPLTQEEVLTTVLPALTLPYWQYHANESADREMGIAPR